MLLLLSIQIIPVICIVKKIHSILFVSENISGISNELDFTPTPEKFECYTLTSREIETIISDYCDGKDVSKYHSNNCNIRVYKIKNKFVIDHH